MSSRSLRFRLLAGAAAAIFAALALAWVAMGFLFEAHIERGVEADLIQHGRDIVSGLGYDADGALVVDPAPVEPRFERPSSGLYWQAIQNETTVRSRSLWDETIAPNKPVGAATWTRGDVAGPFGQKLVFVARQVTLNEGGAPILVMLGADHAAVTAARAQFSRDLGLFLILLWAGLSAAAWLQVGLGLKPLDDVRAALAEMQLYSSKRLEHDAYPEEAAPLAQAINALAEARQRDLDRARGRAGDLAHSLKTPLAALAAQIRRAREEGATSSADGLDRALEGARGVVERELARARLAAEPCDASVEVAPVLERLISVLERTDAGDHVSFETDLSQATLPLSAGALMEIAGPLLENAARFARARVRVSGTVNSLRIEDDGPGMNESEAALALLRGKRLDESEPGQGLGLAIAQETAEATGGRLMLGQSSLGGLMVDLTWSRNV